MQCPLGDAQFPRDGGHRRNLAESWIIRMRTAAESTSARPPPIQQFLTLADADRRGLRVSCGHRPGDQIGGKDQRVAGAFSMVIDRFSTASAGRQLHLGELHPNAIGGASAPMSIGRIRNRTPKSRSSRKLPDVSRELGASKATTASVSLSRGAARVEI